MPRVLFFLQLPPPIHGVSLINSLIIDNPFIKKSFQFKVVELKFTDSFTEIRKYNFRKIICFFKICRLLRNNLKNFLPDLVYFSFMPVGPGFIRDYFFLELIRKYSNNIIIHLHNRGIVKHSENIIFRLLYKRVFNNLTVVHVSEKLLNEEFQYIKITNCKLTAINNTCILSQSEKSSNPHNTFNVLFLSNLFPEKGARIALEAISCLQTKYPDLRLHIYGQVLREKFSRSIKNFVLSEKIDKVVSFHGIAYEEMKFKAFTEADIFIFPSYFAEECSPISILEAMQHRLPIIASNIGAINEMLEDGISAMLIEPKNVSQLAEKIEILINNKDLRIKLGNAAYQKFQEKYTRNIFDRKIYSIIKSQI